VAALPDVPTLMESGLSDFDVQGWFALMAPKGTPSAIVAKLNAAINTALASAEMQKSFAASSFGLPVAPNTPTQTGAFVNAEIDKWARVVKTAKLEMD